MKVKPLEWTHWGLPPTGGDCFASVLHHRYEVYSFGEQDCRWELWVSGMWRARGDCETVEAAKAAAEADWQRRGAELLANIAEPSDDYQRGYDAGIEAAAAMVEQRAREAYGKADALAAMQPAFSPATRNEREHAILAHELEELAGKIRKLGDKA